MRSSLHTLAKSLGAHRLINTKTASGKKSSPLSTEAMINHENHSTPVLSHSVYLEGQQYRYGALVGSYSSQQIACLSTILKPDADTPIVRLPDGELEYLSLWNNENLSATISVDKSRNIEMVKIKNSQGENILNVYFDKKIVGNTFTASRQHSGIRHFLPTAKGVKTSKHSSSGFKRISDNQACDRHGNLVTNALREAAVVYAHPPAATALSEIIQQHIHLPVSQRTTSAYAEKLRRVLHQEDRPENISVRAELYSRNDLPLLPSVQKLNAVLASLDTKKQDEIRLSEYLYFLQAQAKEGKTIMLPEYYHCTTEEHFENMMLSDTPQIKVSTPRSGTGGRGAWLSTSPEITAYGHYILAFNHNIDLIHSTTDPVEGKMSVREVKHNTHIPIQEPISLTSKVLSPTEHPLMLIGVSSTEVESFKSMAGRLGEHLNFTHRNGFSDTAIFSSETVQKMAMLLRDQEPARIPLNW